MFCTCSTPIMCSCGHYRTNTWSSMRDIPDARVSYRHAKVYEPRDRDSQSTVALAHDLVDAERRISMLQFDLSEAETRNADLEEENTNLRLEIQDLKVELAKTRRSNQ